MYIHNQMTTSTLPRKLYFQREFHKSRGSLNGSRSDLARNVLPNSGHELGGNYSLTLLQYCGYATRQRGAIQGVLGGGGVKQRKFL